MTITKRIVPVLGLALALAGTARADDATYCKALAREYQRYVVKIDAGHAVNRGSTAASVALAQCQSGNPAGIPVLERELQNAKVELPARS
jgi:hypothetical protein